MTESLGIISNILFSIRLYFLVLKKYFNKLEIKMTNKLVALLTKNNFKSDILFFDYEGKLL